MRKNLAAAVFASALALSLRAPAAQAQKALVYCPVGIDASGCDRIVTALTSKFPDGVDRAYDGSGGTLDLKAIDLNHYGVFIVPSLADDEDKQPYALLRAAASRLHLAINGRVAVYSGAPDQGNANRADKDAIIQNLATWAAAGHTRATSLVGMVALLDLSTKATDRYGWVRSVSLADVSADADLQSFGDVTPMSSRNGDPLLAGGAARRFTNMASYGLHIGARAAARTEVGAIGGATSGESNGQSVLVLYSNADGRSGGTKVGASALNKAPSSGASLDATAGGGASGPTVTTDKPDYQPGDTVLFTGSGWTAGDTVTITVHEDPQWSNPDRTTTAVADGNGNISSHDFVVQPRDFGVTFTATAVGNPSGLVAQTTFTDGNASSVSGTVTDASNNSALAGVTVSCTTTSGCNANISTTTDASGNYVFNGGNKLSFATNGPVTLTLTFSKSGFVTGSLTLSNVNNSNTLTNQNIALTPAGPTKLAFPNAPVTGVVNQCLTISIQTQNAGGTPTNVTSNTTVNLTTDNGSTGTGAFYTSAACTTTTTTIQISSGSSSGTLFYEATARGSGSHKLTVSDNANVLTSANQTETINKAAQAALSITSPTAGTFGDKLTIVTTGGSGTGAVSFDATGSTACAIITTPGPDLNKLQITSGTGTCSITATKAADNDFNSVTSAAQAVTVSKAAQTITFAALANKTYGDPDFTVTATATSGLAVTFTVGATDQCTTTSSGTVHLTGAGSCTVKADQAGDANYTAAPQVPQTFTIAKKTVTVATLSANNKPYDGNNIATLTGGTLNGVVAGDEANVSLDISGATATFADAFAGTNKLVTAINLGLSGSAKGNYVLNPTTATTHANIDQKVLTASITASGKEYDGNTNVIGAVNCSVATKVGTDDVGCIATGAVFDSPSAGSRTITANVALNGGAKDNYTLGVQATASVGATITKRAASVSAVAASKTYGDADPALTTTNSNFVAADLGAGKITFSASRALGETVAGSPYLITPAANDNGSGLLNNYTVTPNTANFTIDRRAASVTAQPASKTYGDADPVFGTTNAGFLAADLGAAKITFSATRALGESVAGSPYLITPAASDNGSGLLNNYTVTPNTASFTINKRAASVSAVAASKTYGDADPTPFSTTNSNFVAADLGAGKITFSATRALGESVAGSPYLITPAASDNGSGLLNNYTVTQNTANFTINKRAASVSAVAASKTYGDPDPTLTTTNNNFVGADLGAGKITFSATRALGETVAGSPYLITPAFIDNGSGLLNNYTVTTYTAGFTIKPRPASVTPNAASKAYGDPDPTFTGTLSGFLAADNVTATYGRAPGGDTPGNGYTISASLSPLAVLGNYAITSNTAVFTITNDTPIITSLVGPPGPVALGSPVTVTGTFSDHGFAGDTYVISSTWMNGVNSLSVPNVGASSYNGNTGAFSITAPNSIAAGVYTVTVVVTDKWAASSAPVSVVGYVVVYDPNGGFVTGGGWINSPQGAYVASPSLVGKATFGFVSKYKKGQTTPDGDTEFQFQAAGLNFKSTSYDWLVISGNKAQYKGSGTINGSGDYGFILTATDGDMKAKGTPDTFRLKIVNKTTGATVYDNQIGSTDTSDSADPTTTLGGGSIQIHSGN